MFVVIAYWFFVRNFHDVSSFCDQLIDIFCSQAFCWYFWQDFNVNLAAVEQFLFFVEDMFVRAVNDWNDWDLSVNSGMKSSFFELVNFTGISASSFGENPKLHVFLFQVHHSSIHCFTCFSPCTSIDEFHSCQPCTDPKSAAKVNKLPFRQNCYLRCGSYPNVWKQMLWIKRQSLIIRKLLSLPIASWGLSLDLLIDKILLEEKTACHSLPNIAVKKKKKI